MRIFTRQRDIRDPHARHWIKQWLIGKVDMQDAKNMEGYDEMLQKLLASVPPEQCLAGLAPEQVMGRYTADERLAGYSAGYSAGHSAGRFFVRSDSILLVDRYLI